MKQPNAARAGAWARALNHTWDSLRELYPSGSAFADALPLDEDWIGGPVEALAPWATEACRAASRELRAIPNDVVQSARYEQLCDTTPFFQHGCEFEEQIEAVQEVLDFDEPDSEELGSLALKRARDILGAIASEAMLEWGDE